jgi:AraC family transcriptional regulator
MLLTDFPDLLWLKNEANQRFASRKSWDGKTLPQAGWPNVILNTKTKHTYRDNIKGPFSIFTNLTGNSTVITGGKTMKLNEGYFCISNSGEEYTLAIEDQSTTETFNIHFGDNFVSDAYRALSQTHEQLLDAPQRQPHQLRLFNRIAPIDLNARCLMYQLKDAKDPAQEEETLFKLFAWLVREEQTIKQKSVALSVAKKSTREEIMARLLLATDYIYSYYQHDIALDELAQVACLSKFHFLRVFKAVFHKTPHQFINEVRTQRAQELLTTTKLEVHQIAKTCGFQTSSTFSRMFFNQLGVYPSLYRAHN